MESEEQRGWLRRLLAVRNVDVVNLKKQPDYAETTLRELEVERYELVREKQEARASAANEGVRAEVNEAMAAGFESELDELRREVAEVRALE